MAVRCSRCHCGHCPARGPSIEKIIVYRGEEVLFQRRRRICRRCGHVFYTREFAEHKEHGQPTPVNPFFTRDFLERDGKPEEQQTDPIPNPFL